MAFINLNINLNIFLLIALINLLTPSVIHPYSFCPNCVHFTTEIQIQTNPQCNLFKSHPLFKDRIDVDFIGKEICTIKGKYFIHKNETKSDDIFK